MRAANVIGLNFEPGDGTALHAATQIGNLPMVQVLLHYGADVNAVYNNGKTALHMAESLDIVRELLSKGANINAEDEDGQTPYALAFQHGHDEAAAHLRPH